jgi:SAM-dependent methyltransferase
LAQFKSWTNSPDSWESHWAEHLHQYLLELYSTGYLGEFEIFTRYLPKNDPVLEAGCGLGQLVMALAKRGYHVEGVDYAEQTVARIQALAPKLNVRVGNVYALDVPDGFYGGYISMGVFEHDSEGPLSGLREARRVMKPDGVAFITVPYLNPQRKKWLQKLGTSNDWRVSVELKFYQYYFSVIEFTQYLEQTGFEVQEVFPYAVSAGLTRDFAFGLWLEGKRFFHWRLKKWFLDLCEHAPTWARRRWGHMLMFVCRPAMGKS